MVQVVPGGRIDPGRGQEPAALKTPVAEMPVKVAGAVPVLESWWGRVAGVRVGLARKSW